MAIQEPLEVPRVLLLKNYPSASPSDTLMLDSFLTNIQNTIPNAELDICCIVNGDQIPDISNYRLVILSGGKVNLLEEEKPQWALQVLEMVRNIAKEPGTGPKLLGICWGHQAIHYALGGDLAWVGDGPRVSEWNVVNACISLSFAYNRFRLASKIFNSQPRASKCSRAMYL